MNLKPLGSKTFPVISGILDPEESYYLGFHSDQDLNKISEHKRHNASTFEGLQLLYSYHSKGRNSRNSSDPDINLLV